MSEKFADIFTVGEHKNSLGRAQEVVHAVLADQSRLDELYQCIRDEDAWVRMRAIDSLEKVCREHPEWLEPYIDDLLSNISTIDQASIQWHLAEIFDQVTLTSKQRQQAIDIMKRNISSKDADWIVASNTMKTLAHFVELGYLPASELAPLLEIQQNHHSNAVVKRATALRETVQS